MTQISDAKKGILTDEMKHVAKIEGVSEEFILNSVAKGTIVIPGNVHRDIDAAGIGAGLRTKVNATVGTSTDIVDFDEEDNIIVQKLTTKRKKYNKEFNHPKMKRKTYLSQEKTTISDYHLIRYLGRT